MFSVKLTKDTGESTTVELPAPDQKLCQAGQDFGLQYWLGSIVIGSDTGHIRSEISPDCEMGKHLMRLFPGKYTLEDANDMAHIVVHASDLIKDELEQNIIHDQYGSVQELRDDIRQMTYNAGTASKTYYFPITGKIWDPEYEEYTYPGKRFLLSQEDAIRDSLSEYISRDLDNMSAYYFEDGADKLLLADWGIEVIGDKLWGKVDVRLTEPMTGQESLDLQDFILGQNSDGLGEGFEQQPIPTDRGDLYVSFWDSGLGYFIKDEEEMGEYLGHSGHRFGGM